jgi:hypothetical protein
MQNQSPRWKRYIECILELWRWCALTSWEKVLRWTLYWNPKKSLSLSLYIYIYIYIYKHHKEGGRNWWHLASTRKCQASHKCCHHWRHCTFGVYSATTCSLQPRSNP